MSNTILNPGVIPNTSDAVATLIENAVPADLARIQASVSGAGIAKTIGATRAWAGAMQPQASFANYSWQVRAELPCLPADICGIRFAVLSHPTADQTFIATVGAAAQWTGKNLTGGGSWQYSGFDGSDYGAFTPCVVKTKAQRYSDLAWSDWAPISGETRTDGGTWAVVVVRVYQQSGAAVQTVGNASTDAPMSTLAYPKLKYLTDFQSGDFVSANRDSFAGGSNPGCSPIVAIEFLTKSTKKTYAVADFGDSIECGYSTAIRGNGPICDAAAEMNAAGTYSISPMMQGSAGEPADAYFRRLQMWLKTPYGRPSIAILRPYSRNNGRILQRDYTAMFGFLDSCAAAGITPVLSTGMYESSDTANNPFMLASNAQTRSVASRLNIPLLELEDLWTASAPLADGIHPGNAEQALMVPRYISAITEAIKLRGG